MPRSSMAAFVAAVLLLAGCGPTSDSSPSPSPTPSVPKPQVSADFVTRLDGSTATIPLGSAVLTALTGTDEGMVFNKTDVAYENLIAGSKDLILVTYPSQEEFQMAADAGVELDVIPVVKDALVFLANTGNKVDNLSQDQVKDIYTGKTTNWSQVGGSDAAIIPYQRQVNSGSQTLFLKLAMGDVTPMDAPTDMRPSFMSELVDMIADYDDSTDAIGYSMFYYATEMYMKDTVKLLAIDGVTPSAQTISDGTFAYITNYYAVVRKDTPEDSDARKVIEWMLGDEAQQLASRNNYVPLDPANIRPPEPTYGYFGSTAENTTQSSGTGGTQMKSLEWDWWSDPSPVTCDNDGNGNIISCSYAGNEAMSAALTQWVSDHPGNVDVESAKDFIVVSNLGPQGAYATEVISPTGEPMPLSDFFYDSVNYISYINQNLFNETTNTEYYDWLHNDLYMGVAHDPPSGFTGIPNDYPNFTLETYNTDGLLLKFIFPQGNPFISESVETDADGNSYTSNMASIGLWIPSDLSPYGRISSTRWTQSPASQIYPVLTTTSTPSASDGVLNGKIQAQVSAHPEKGCFMTRYGADRVSLLGYANANACRSPNGVTGFPTLLGQWAFGTWDDDPMTIADLPSTWRTQLPESLGAPDGLACLAQDESNCQEWFVVTSFSSAASVRSVWAYGSRLQAVVVDQGSVYLVPYDVTG